MPKVFADAAFADYLEWQATDRKTWQRINELIKSIERDGANRLVYEVSNDTITIQSCKGHYDN